jgi:SMC interacting uncharacterized protein involved in chromosome segregation
MGSSAVPSAPTKDPRPIRDKSYQYECIRGLINFLAGANYDQALSQKTLAVPSSKDFQSIFRFVYSMLDPHHDWKNKKFEEEVPMILKAIRCDALASILSRRNPLREISGVWRASDVSVRPPRFVFLSTVSQPSFSQIPVCG